MKITPVSYRPYKTNFLANYSKENNVVILGSSKNGKQIEEYCKIAAQTAEAVVRSGKNIITGCGNSGIMGAAYYSAAKHSKKDSNNKPEQNLVILTEKLWGDENTDDCVVIGKAKTEGSRVDKFIENAKDFVIFPGSAGTMLEATSLISHNYYQGRLNPDMHRNIILVGKDCFKELDDLYKKLHEMELLAVNPSALYTIVDEADDILKELGVYQSNKVESETDLEE